MGADPTAKVSRMFGVYNEDNGLDLRGSFLIDPEGRVARRWVGLDHEADEILADLERMAAG